jgi:FdhE protein
MEKIMGMHGKEMATVDHIRKAVAAAQANRPAYKEILDFYEELFLAQEAVKGQMQLEPMEISKELLSVKRQEHLPLINKTDFAVDTKGARALLRKICELAVEANKALAEAAPKIAHALDRGTLEASVLFSKTLSEDEAYFDEVARTLEVDGKVLAFMAYFSMKPSISLCAEQLATYLDKDGPWEKGYCPICGSPPALSMLCDEGQRSLLCSFCGHQWQTLRIYCPFCSNRNQNTLYYFFSEEEEGYRVDVCDRCKKYIKTVDIRKMKRPIHTFVEQISTLHLDMLAQEQGLESGIPLWLRT